MTAPPLDWLHHLADEADRGQPHPERDSGSQAQLCKVSSSHKLYRSQLARIAASTWLARERLEQIIFDRSMRGYAYVVNVNYPASETLTGDFSPFTRATQILEVSSANLTTASNGSGYKRATVTISWTGGNSIQLETLVTLWGS